MSKRKSDEELKRDRRARTAAKAWVRAHHLPEGYRKFLIYVLTEWLDEHRTFFVGTRALSERTDISRPVVIALMNEFITKGVIVVLNEPGRGGKRLCRLDYERIAEAYPQRNMDTGERTRKAVNELDHLDDGEAADDGREVVNQVDQSAATLCDAETPKVVNGVCESGQVSGMKVVKNGLQSGQAALPEQLEQLTPEQSPLSSSLGARASRALTALAVPTRASDVQAQQQCVLQRTAKKERREVTVDDLVAQFRKLCDEGLCSWTTHRVLHTTMLREFARLIRERIVTADTMRKALPIAQKRVGKVGRPSGAAITRAMFEVAKVRPAKPTPTEDKPFFERPVPAAGTYTLPGNDTRH